MRDGTDRRSRRACQRLCSPPTPPPNSLLAPGDAILVLTGIYRVGDALSRARWGKNCDADLTYMGQVEDGREVRRSISSANPSTPGPSDHFQPVRHLHSNANQVSTPSAHVSSVATSAPQRAYSIRLGSGPARSPRRIGGGPVVSVLL